MLKRQNEIAHPSSGYGSGFFELVHILFLAVAVAGILNYCVFGIIKIEQYSMEPTLNNAERVYLSKCAYWLSEPKRGDIIVFFDEGTKTNLVKRVIGLPGERIEIKDGNVYCNGERLDEPYIKEKTSGNYEVVVPDGMYFCMGDNRNKSIDSRDERIGCIPRSDIIGKAIFVISPPRSLK